jgi:adenosylcobinamide kinase / adenosylcobinamide-phosphate guanylyltransferase
MSAEKVIVIGGGVRSGKSAFAVATARRLGMRRAFVATAQAFDDEMRERIARHVEERADLFTTIEEPVALPARLASIEGEGFDVVLVDCLTLWLSNLLLGGTPESRALAEVDALAEVLARRRFTSILVTNEVGMGIVPESALGRAFRDLAGRAHQRLARVADEIHIAALGLVLRLHPAPIEVVSRGGAA